VGDEEMVDAMALPPRMLRDICVAVEVPRVVDFP
jgi:hypothetical protein